jgi:hypothetical protein
VADDPFSSAVFYQGREVRGREMSAVLFSARVSLNILRLQGKGSHTMRTFEAPASGAFVLAERSEEQLEFFEEDREACTSARRKRPGKSSRST